MHQSSLDNMKKALTFIDVAENCSILEVGGRGLRGDRSYRSLFEKNLKQYHIADILDGENVTHVMLDPYKIPVDDDIYDLVISGQTLEHVKNPFRLVAEMKRVLKPNGYMILIAPSAGSRHDLVDCWRFMDDAFQAIAEEINLKIIADWIDASAVDKRSIPWRDHIFVGQKI